MTVTVIRMKIRCNQKLQDSQPKMKKMKCLSKKMMNLCRQSSLGQMNQNPGAFMIKSTIIAGCISSRLVSISLGRAVFHSDSAKKKKKFSERSQWKYGCFSSRPCNSLSEDCDLGVGLRCGDKEGVVVYQTNLCLQSKGKTKIKNLFWQTTNVKMLKLE